MTSAPTGDALVPEGFEPFGRQGPFVQQFGPMYLRPTPEGLAVLAVRVRHEHTNRRGVCHGGLLTTMVDDAVAICSSLARGKHGDHATVSLSAEFLSPAKVGDWLEAHTTLRRVGRRLVFGDVTLKVGERQVMRGTAIYAVGLGHAVRDEPPSVAPEGE
jgi:acyl-coenzyme A thioesterase 13